MEWLDDSPVFPFKHLEGLAVRLPPVRFTVRRLMAAVAVVAVAIGIATESARWKRRWEYCACWAGFHSHLEADIEPSCRFGCPHAVDPAPRYTDHARLRREYERAARLPWARLPVDPMKSRWERGEYVMAPPPPLFPVKAGSPLR